MTETTNIHGTDEGNLTVVLPDGDVRGQLTAMMREHGADSAIGHRCTNLLQLTETFDKVTERRLGIAGLIDRQLADLKRLLAVSRGD